MNQAQTKEFEQLQILESIEKAQHTNDPYFDESLIYGRQQKHYPKRKDPVKEAERKKALNEELDRRKQSMLTEVEYNEHR